MNQFFKLLKYRLLHRNERPADYRLERRNRNKQAREEAMRNAHAYYRRVFDRVEYDQVQMSSRT